MYSAALKGFPDSSSSSGDPHKTLQYSIGGPPSLPYTLTYLVFHLLTGTLQHTGATAVLADKCFPLIAGRTGALLLVTTVSNDVEVFIYFSGA